MIMIIIIIITIVVMMKIMIIRIMTLLIMMIIIMKLQEGMISRTCPWKGGRRTKKRVVYMWSPMIRRRKM